MNYGYIYLDFKYKEELLIIAVHVDDIRLFNKSPKSPLRIEEFKFLLAKVFKMTDEGEGTCYLGTHLERSQNNVKHQSTYTAKVLDHFDLCSLAPARTPCEPNTKLCDAEDHEASEELGHKYLAMFGSLNYLLTIARPDLAYAILPVGRYNSNPTLAPMDAVTRIYAYLLKSRITMGISRFRLLGMFGHIQIFPSFWGIYRHAHGGLGFLGTPLKFTDMRFLVMHEAMCH